MSIQALISRIQSEIDELDLESLSPETAFLEIEGWNSLYGLILMALVSTEYNVDLTGKQIQSIKTVQDLYDTISTAA